MGTNVEITLGDPVTIRHADYDEFDLARLCSVLMAAEVTPRFHLLTIVLDEASVTSLLDTAKTAMASAEKWDDLVDNMMEHMWERRDDA